MGLIENILLRSVRLACVSLLDMSILMFSRATSLLGKMKVKSFGSESVHSKEEIIRFKVNSQPVFIARASLSVYLWAILSY